LAGLYGRPKGQPRGEPRGAGTGQVDLQPVSSSCRLQSRPSPAVAWTVVVVVVHVAVVRGSVGPGRAACPAPRRRVFWASSPTPGRTGVDRRLVLFFVLFLASTSAARLHVLFLALLSLRCLFFFFFFVRFVFFFFVLFFVCFSARRDGQLAMRRDGQLAMPLNENAPQNVVSETSQN